MRLIFISTAICIYNICATSQDTMKVDYLNEANKLLVLSEYKKAENSFMRAIEIYKISNDTDRIVECKFGIATIKYLEGKYRVAVELFESLRDNKSINLNENQREAIKSSISICKELIKTSPLKN